jgi:hypothetical protein
MFRRTLSAYNAPYLLTKCPFCADWLMDYVLQELDRLALERKWLAMRALAERQAQDRAKMEVRYLEKLECIG